MPSGKIHIGTSGWSYKHWKGPFYPRALPNARLLEYYARQFDSVEINNSFYRLPSAERFAQWRAAVPPGFVFAVKASRYITHMKKLADPAQSIARLLERIEALGEKRGPLLFQLPPRWLYDGGRLQAFLAALPRGRCAFEFRDHSWLNEEAYALLERHGAALCLYDLGGYSSPKRRTADFVYVRLHGPRRAYRGSYDDRALRRWARDFRAWSAEGCTVYCYFDNDEAGHALEDARRLRVMLEED